MKLRAKVKIVHKIAEHTVDCDDIEKMKVDLLETARKFPETLNFRRPKEDEKIVIEIEQVG
jgi:hypothetical protein